MGSRKRARRSPNEENGVPSSSIDQAEVHSQGGQVEVGQNIPDVDGGGDRSEQTMAQERPQTVKADDDRRPRTSKSWYGANTSSWTPGKVPKASAVTQVARESISASSPAPSDVESSSKSQKSFRAEPASSSFYLARNVVGSLSSLPGTPKFRRQTVLPPSEAQPRPGDPVADQNGAKLENATESKQQGPSVPSETSQSGPQEIPNLNMHGAGSDRTTGTDDKLQSESTQDISQKNSAPSGGWFGWLSKSAPSEGSTIENQNRPAGGDVGEPGQQPKAEISDDPNTEVGEPGKRQDASNPPEGVLPTGSLQESNRAKPWFPRWSAESQAQTTAEAPDLTKDPGSDPAKENQSSSNDTLMQGTSGNGIDVDSTDPRLGPSSGKPPGWAFWSRDGPKLEKTPGGSDSNTGELAVANTASQSKPEAARIEPPKDRAKSEITRLGKRERPQSMEVEDESSGRTLRQTSKNSTPSHSPAPSKGKIQVSDAGVAQTQKASPSNLVLPSFRQTYHLLDNPSILQQIARLLRYSKESNSRHLHIVREPPRIKKALAIGVHGFFPAPFLRTVLGQPTGTSIRFANSAADAIRKWSESHGYEIEIDKVALEGEGKIAERVDMLWKLLLNWIDHIQKADFILIACHSQGVPVAMMLVAKLIEFGCVNSARIGVCAMAGVNLGPFPDYKSRLFSGSAAELFEFSRPESDVSRRYEQALRVALHHGVRILYVGSIDDQLVSLESSTFSPISHPYIFRAVFVDGRVHAPDFISHLVGFALKLRNLGISDHGLIRELSAPLAGSLYTGEGHSRIYDDQKVYDLAVEHALETTSVSDVPLEVQRYETPNNSNPFILPWSMRGLLEEEFVRTELDDETSELLKQFDDWKPSSKVLKDVKFRLEAIRSKL